MKKNKHIYTKNLKYLKSNLKQNLKFKKIKNAIFKRN